MTETLRRAAYAKINLTLDVGRRRPDGYHEIRSIMQTISLCDFVQIERSDFAGGINLVVDGPCSSGVPTDNGNLVYRAAVRMREKAGLSAFELGLTIRLEKNIPSQAGLGGGSSDAATTLLLLNDLFGLRKTSAELCSIAASLGGDVSFFLYGGTALVEGIGDRVTPIATDCDRRIIVVVKPSDGVSTADAYRALDSARRDSGSVNQDIITATDTWLADINAERTDTWANDFEPVVLRLSPTIASAYAMLADISAARGGGQPRLAGSGAALFVDAVNADTAAGIIKDVEQARLGAVWLTHTVPGGSRTG